MLVRKLVENRELNGLTFEQAIARLFELGYTADEIDAFEGDEIECPSISIGSHSLEFYDVEFDDDDEKIVWSGWCYCED